MPPCRICATSARCVGAMRRRQPGGRGASRGTSSRMRGWCQGTIEVIAAGSSVSAAGGSVAAAGSSVAAAGGSVPAAGRSVAAASGSVAAAGSSVAAAGGSVAAGCSVACSCGGTLPRSRRRNS
jgi:hypothetical protein